MSWLNYTSLAKLLSDQELVAWQERVKVVCKEITSQDGWEQVGFKLPEDQPALADLRNFEIACNIEFWSRRGKEVIFRLGKMVVVNKEDLLNGQRCTRDDIERIERGIRAHTSRACWEGKSEETSSGNSTCRESEEREKSGEVVGFKQHRRVLEEVEEY